MAWVLKAEGFTAGMVADAVEVRRALSLFADPDGWCQVVALPIPIAVAKRGTDIDGLFEAVTAMPSRQGVYFEINPVRGELVTKAKASDIAKRRWLYLDVDPVKAAGHQDESATDGEKEAARGICSQVNDYLTERGWPAPVVVDSGNGWNLLYRCNLENDKIAQALTQRFLNTLATKFNGVAGKIDKSVHNADRLAKLPGTWARKGPPSEDRPHRPARLVFVPADLESVTLEQLTSAGLEGSPEPKPSANGTYHAPFGGADTSYGKKAIDGECARVALAQPGGENGRNNTLNRAAYSLGQLIAGGVLNRDEVESRLYSAACQCGLDIDPGCGERGIWSTIRSGLEAGLKEPRGPKGKSEPKAKFTAKATSGESSSGEPITISLSSVTPQQVEWLMKDRIAKRFITVFSGRTSVGKSFIAFDLISRLSRGGEIPCGVPGECFPLGGTLIVSEDSPEYVIAPRLITAGADTTKVHCMTWKAMGEYHLANTDMLSQACEEIPGGVTLVLIDPPTNFLEGVDEHKNSEVRQLVMKVVEWVMARDLACIFVLHVNKQTGKGVEALSRVMGSVAWVTTARVAHAFCEDLENPGQKLWVPLKNNLGPLPKAIAYRITENPSKVEWIGEVDMTADEAMGHSEPRPRRDQVAAQWLLERFRDNIEWESDDLFEAAKQHGISRSAVFEAKGKLNLPKARKRTKENGDEVWIWWVPKDWPPLIEEVSDEPE